MQQDRTSVAVVVCTHSRNEPLRTLLRALEDCAEAVRSAASVGVVVVDDNPGGDAEPVVREFDGRFEGGIHYRFSGRENISCARNMAIETGIDLAEWVAMTDDDCEPTPAWLAALLAVQLATGADCVTGSQVLRAPDDTPAWVVDQPFLRDGMIEFTDGERIDHAGTNNSLIRSQWLRDRPEHRFRHDMGRVGGEDMVFYRTAARDGLDIRFSADGFVHGNEPPDRVTFAYLMRWRLWHGNSDCLVALAVGTQSRFRILLRAGNSLRKAVVRPVRRMLDGQPPEFRYALALALRAFGLMAGLVGIRIEHR